MADAAPRPEPRSGRRVSSGAAAIVVLLAMCLGWWLFSGNGPSGPPGNAQLYAVPDETPSGSTAPSVAPPEGAVEIDGFVPEEGNHVALNYTTGARRCVGRLDTPQVLETDAAVTVSLMLVPPTSPPPPRRCGEVVELHTVRVDLDAPLEGRSLLDGSRPQPVRVEQDATTNE